MRPAILRELRISCGLSQADLAAAAEVPRWRISLWEASGSLPPVDACRRIAAIFDRSVNSIFGPTVTM